MPVCYISRGFACSTRMRPRARTHTAALYIGTWSPDSSLLSGLGRIGSHRFASEVVIYSVYLLKLSPTVITTRALPLTLGSRCVSGCNPIWCRLHAGQPAPLRDANRLAFKPRLSVASTAAFNFKTGCLLLSREGSGVQCRTQAR